MTAPRALYTQQPCYPTGVMTNCATSETLRLPLSGRWEILRLRSPLQAKRGS